MTLLTVWQKFAEDFGIEDAEVVSTIVVFRMLTKTVDGLYINHIDDPLFDKPWGILNSIYTVKSFAEDLYDPIGSGFNEFDRELTKCLAKLSPELRNSIGIALRRYIREHVVEIIVAKLEEIYTLDDNLTSREAFVYSKIPANIDSTTRWIIENYVVPVFVKR